MKNDEELNNKIGKKIIECLMHRNQNVRVN